MSFLDKASNWFASRILSTKKRRRAEHRRCLVSPERLEERSMLAVDLIGVDFDVANFTFAPGSSVPLVWQLANQEFSTATSGFEVHFFLSRDPVITTNDLFVGSRFMPPGFPGLFFIDPVFDTIVLPPESNAIWNGSGNYFLGMIVDPFNFVFESNEFNNFNRGFFLDLDVLAVSVASAQQPDLLGTSLAINTASPTAGGQLNVSFGVNNAGSQPAGPFQISFFLSSDANVTTADRFLGSFLSGGLAANGSLANSANFTLPPSGDPIYSGGGPLFVGMIIDSGSAVIEGNEFNNSNRGLGLDVAQVSFNSAGGGFLEDLPATGFPPGEFLKEFLLRAQKYMNEAVSDYKNLAKSSKGIVDVSGVTKSLKLISTDLGKLRSLIEPLRKGSRQTIALGGGVFLDRTQLELTERFLISLLRSLDNDAALSFAGPVAAKQTQSMAFAQANAADDDFATLEAAKRSVLDAFDPARIYGEAAAAFNRAAGAATKTGQVAAAGLAAQASAITTAIGRMARFGRAKILEGDPLAFDQARNQSHETLGSALWDEISSEIREHLPDPNSAGERLLNMLDHLQTANEVISANFDRIRDNFQALFTADRANAFRGKWVGDQSSQVTINGTTFNDVGPASFNFSKAKNGFAPGSAVINFHTLDEGGNVVGRGKTTGSFSGRFTDNETFEGTIELRAPNGLRDTRAFSWRFDGLNLTGALYVGSSTTFSVRKK